MEHTIELIKNFFDKGEWEYNYNEEEHLFLSGIDMGGILGDLKIFIKVRETDYFVYIRLNSKAETDQISNVAEFIHRTNYGILNGNFELDYNDGEIRYKTFVNFEQTSVSEIIVEDSILVGIIMFMKYSKGLFKVMLGESSPLNALIEIEEADEINEEKEHS